MNVERVMLFFTAFLLVIGGWRMYTLWKGTERATKLGVICWFLLAVVDLLQLLLDLPRQLPWEYYLPDAAAVLLFLSMGVLELVLLRRQRNG